MHMCVDVCVISTKFYVQPTSYDCNLVYPYNTLLVVLKVDYCSYYRRADTSLLRATPSVKTMVEGSNTQV
jgi:hypothetical protein